MFNPDPMTLLDELKFTPEQITERRSYIGASEAPIIAGQEPKKINQLARIKRGEAEPEDLSGVLPVIMGSYTEALNIAWFMKTTGRAAHSFQKKCFSTAFPFLRATLDGITTTASGEEANLQCKHVNPFKKLDDVVLHYMPQLQHEMHCSGLNWCVFSVLVGNLEHKIVEIEKDAWYIAQLLEQERLFWDAVQGGYDPQLVAPEPSQTGKPVYYQNYDFSENNNWASLAHDWLTNRPAAATFEATGVALKQSFPPDALMVKGHGVMGTRAKNGAITLKSYVEDSANAQQ